MLPSPDPILSGSLGCQSVGNYATSGAQINFGLDSQIGAGALSTKQVSLSQLIALLALNSATLSVVGSTSAFRPVTLTTADGSPDNCTTLTLDPLGLSAPANQAGIAIGGFGINVPSYTPLPHPELYCGVVALNNNQAIIPLELRRSCPQCRHELHTEANLFREDGLPAGRTHRCF
ncbi:hypothetical protein LZK76_36510 (plasmid) [Rhizobium leguminosarum]|nr:hypothetical protein LZK76_36510 [Rhizobium leguminosarum]